MEFTVSTATQTADCSRFGHAGLESDRSGVLAALDELLGFAAQFLPESPRHDLADARERFTTERFNLVVLGEFKRGKSTLINALLGRDILPTGVVPLTSVVTVIGAGARDRLLVRSHDDVDHEHPIAALADFVTEAGNPHNARGIELAHIELDHDLLRDGLMLVDTPGVGSVHAHNSDAARDFLPRVDGAVCVLDAGQPVSEAERQLFQEIGRRVPRLLIVVNKIDHLDAQDRQVAVDFIQSALHDLLPTTRGEVFPVSARNGEGIAVLRDRLGRLGATDRQQLLVRSVAGLARGAAADVAQAARFEAEAIRLPLEELEARAHIFEQRIAELSVATAEAGDLLDRGVARALQQHVNEPLREHAHREQDRLRAALRQHAEEAPADNPRQLSADLAAWIDTTIRAEFAQLVPGYEATVAGALAELERRYSARVQEVLEQIQRVAHDVFGTRAAEFLPAAGLRAPSRFSFKLRDPEHGLDMIVGFGRTITPGALGRRLVLRDAEQRLIDMTDRHAGRLRSELAERVAAAARQYRRELVISVDEAIAAIHDAIDRAGDDHRRGADHARSRLEQLAEIARRSDQLAATFQRFSSDDESMQSAPRP